jgi:hypothetical protein
MSEVKKKKRVKKDKGPMMYEVLCRNEFEELLKKYKCKPNVKLTMKSDGTQSWDIEFVVGE